MIVQYIWADNGKQSGTGEDRKSEVYKEGLEFFRLILVSNVPETGPKFEPTARKAGPMQDRGGL
jgi:hypothetical protein